MADAHSYSTIRREPIHKSAVYHTIGSIYDKFINPLAILAQIPVWLALLHGQDLKARVHRAAEGDSDAILYCFLILVSLVLGLRIIQSICLARRDYAHLETKATDVVVFLAVMTFMCGAVLYVFGNYLTWVLVAYAVLCLIGTINFIDLYRRRIPASCSDLAIERRIQAVNALALGALTLCFACAAFATGLLEGVITEASACLVLGMLLIAFNALHSHELTMADKYLIHNRPDDPKRVAAAFRDHFGHLSSLDSDSDILAAILGPSPRTYRPLETERAGLGDCDTIADAVLAEFSYAYKYVFRNPADARLRALVVSLLKSNGGCGPSGFTNYYFIMDRKTRERIGLFRIDGVESRVIYRIAEGLTAPFLVAWHLRSINLLPMWRRARAVYRSQRPAKPAELCVTHLIVFRQFRRQGYATAFLFMLRNAFLRHRTNDVITDRISLCVRDTNTFAELAFAAAGFTPEQDRAAHVEDPLARIEGVGKAHYLACLRSE